jgi:hypothetical protein
MKKTLFLILLYGSFSTAHAQLANTKWKVSLQLESLVETMFVFSGDSLKVYTVADSMMLESMSFSVKDTVLTIKKAYGQSNCDATAVGKYKYEMKSDGMYVTLLSDDCVDRSSVLDKTKWVKMP